MNGNTRGFHPQTKKVELCTKQIVPSATTAEEASFEWSNHRISSSQTQKLQKHYKSPRVKKLFATMNDSIPFLYGESHSQRPSPAFSLSNDPHT